MEIPNAFELEALDEFLFNLPEWRALIPTMRVESREHDSDGFWVTFGCPDFGPEGSFSLDSEILLPHDKYVDAELWIKGEHVWRLHVWNVHGPWDGDVSGYRFVSP